jgi:uncharacterized protein (DUF488 family)
MQRNNAMSQQIFTIGHSNQSLAQFLGLLAQHRIEVIVDIRRFPSSRKFPHFNRDNLAAALQDAGIEYHWLEGLGGRRRENRPISANLGLENESFRNYADYMLTEQFREALGKLREIARRKRTCLMCAESVYWRCHRRLVSDFLLANQVPVEHIFPSGELRPHQPTPGSRLEAGQVTYPAEQKSLFP